MAEPEWVRIKAVPLTENHGAYIVECSVCGTLEVVVDTETDEFCLTHLEDVHQVDTGGYRS